MIDLYRWAEHDRRADANHGAVVYQIRAQIWIHRPIHSGYLTIAEGAAKGRANAREFARALCDQGGPEVVARCDAPCDSFVVGE